MRLVTCLLLKKSPWLNATEPKWIHGKRRVVEPYGLLGAHELAERVCAAFGCPHYEHLSITKNVALSCTKDKRYQAAQGFESEISAQPQHDI